MQQQFETVKISIKELLSWNARGELVLQPKFQRRDVWSDKARSYAGLSLRSSTHRFQPVGIQTNRQPRIA